MPIIKEIQIYCTDCGYEDSATDSSTDFDKFYELEEDACPKCLEKGADAL